MSNRRPMSEIFKNRKFKRRITHLPTSASPAEYHDHTWENGRRYQGHTSEFPWPNDEDATKAYGLRGAVWVHMLNPESQRFMAPITLHRGSKVLNCTALNRGWTNLLEDQYPGVRISVIEPGYAWLYPPHITVHHQLEGDWPFTSRQAFHLIYAQGLAGMIKNYEGLYQNAYKHLLPGGWFEVRENNLQFFTDTASPEKEEKLVSLRMWEKLIAEAAEKFGKPINVAGRQKELMEMAGFTDVREEVFKVPFGHWMEGERWYRVASSYSHHMRYGLESYTLRLFTKTLGWSFEDTMALIRRIQVEIAECELKNLELYSYFHLVIGKKPDNASRKPEDVTEQHKNTVRQPVDTSRKPEDASGEH